MTVNEQREEEEEENRKEKFKSIDTNNIRKINQMQVHALHRKKHVNFFSLSLPLEIWIVLKQMMF